MDFRGLTSQILKTKGDVQAGSCNYLRGVDHKGVSGPFLVQVALMHP